MEQTQQWNEVRTVEDAPPTWRTILTQVEQQMDSTEKIIALLHDKLGPVLIPVDSVPEGMLTSVQARRRTTAMEDALSLVLTRQESLRAMLGGLVESVRL